MKLALAQDQVSAGAVSSDPQTVLQSHDLQPLLMNAANSHNASELVWIYSSVAVVVISLVGLLGVVAIPVMRRIFYKSLLQFLVALAVGALAGDALLHLLPHALSGSHSVNVNHSFMEGNRHHAENHDPAMNGHHADHHAPAMNGHHADHHAPDMNGHHADLPMPTGMDSHHPQHQSPTLGSPYADHTMEGSHADYADSTFGDPHADQAATALTVPHADYLNHSSGHPGAAHADHGEDLSGVWKGAVALGGLLLFFLSERLLTILAHRRQRTKQQKKMALSAKGNNLPETGHHSPLLFNNNVSSNNEDFFMYLKETAIMNDDDVTAPQPSVLNYHHHHHHHHHHDLQQHSTQVPEQQVVGQGHGGHGHSHHHGDVPGSLSAVAAMVIMGDGIHNFSDGLAIGAAFAASVTGGLSTTVAVFCHELPHEIGDFAMLLSAGMSGKQATLYNLLSSVLCFLGMVVGVLLGQVQDASAWIFCAVAGMFLYISMADMLPQLNIRVEEGLTTPGRQLLLQCAGVGLGAGVMLTIAVYEHDLKTIFDSS